MIMSSATVVLDHTHTNNDSLLHWVRSSPLSGRIHVYLRRAPCDSPGRSLQNALQALGCTVTMRSLRV